MEKGRNTAILGPTDFLSDARTCWVVREEPPPQRSPTKKTPKIKKKNHRLWDRTHEMVCVIITDFTYGTEDLDWMRPRDPKQGRLALGKRPQQPEKDEGQTAQHSTRH